MKIVVTGGAGFVGSSLCIELKKKYPSYTIVAFDNLKRRGSEINVSEFIENEIEFIHGDIRNVEDFDSLDNFDIMIEASAEPSVLAGLNSDPTYVINNNLVGSINCFNLCVKNKAKLIFLSTSRVYPIERIENANFIESDTRFSFDTIQNEIGISERGISEELSILGSRSFYGTTKLSSELFIQEYSAFYGLEAAVIRFGVIAGPRQMGKIDQGVVTLWLAKHYWNQKLAYIGYGGLGKQVRDIIHISDVIDLIDMQIHQLDKFANKIYNVGGGVSSSASLLELTDICQQLTGNIIPIESIFKNRTADLKVYISDSSKITKDTGWAPKKNVNDIMNDIFKWINQNEKTLKHWLK